MAGTESIRFFSFFLFGEGEGEGVVISIMEVSINRKVDCIIW